MINGFLIMIVIVMLFVCWITFNFVVDKVLPPILRVITYQISKRISKGYWMYVLEFLLLLAILGILITRPHTDDPTHPEMGRVVLMLSFVMISVLIIMIQERLQKIRKFPPFLIERVIKYVHRRGLIPKDIIRFFMQIGSFMVVLFIIIVSLGFLIFFDLELYWVYIFFFSIPFTLCGWIYLGHFITRMKIEEDATSMRRIIAYGILFLFVVYSNGEMLVDFLANPQQLPKLKPADWILYIWFTTFIAGDRFVKTFVEHRVKYNK